MPVWNSVLDDEAPADGSGPFHDHLAKDNDAPTALADLQTAPRRPAAGYFSIVVLPDTQYYASDHPEIFEAQTRWIVDQRTAGNIMAVLHEGDIVDRDEPRQWERASRSLHVLDGVVPYVLCAGNHDYHRAGSRLTRESMINAYFSETTTAQGSTDHATYQPHHLEDSFQIVDAPGGAWLIVSLEFGPGDAALEWAATVVRQHANLSTIVLTHAYLDSDGARYGQGSGLDQMWSPHRYLPGAAVGDVNDGDEIWRKLVARNRNIRFVLCGHALGDGIARLTSQRPDGSKVHQLLANYQMGARGGDGYLRIMQFYPADRRVAVRTYSPYLDRAKADPDNDFDLTY